MNVSFIGLGIMGLPMAKHLYRAGYLYKVYNRTRAKADYFLERGLEVSHTPKEAAAGANYIITIVSNSSDVEEVILGRNGVIHSASRGSTIIDMSSINPEISKQISLRLNEKGIQFIDAPVSGGEQGAIAGKLAIMVGGREEVVKDAEKVLKVMGSPVHVGAVGSGGYAKLANQIMVALHLQAMSEAFTLAKKANLDAEQLYLAIRNGLAGSHALDQKVSNIVEGEYEPGFKVSLHLKDLNNVLDAANELGVHLPITNEIQRFMKEMHREGMGELDHSSLYTYLQKKQ
ncbi:NAD(P)-dependent oxidoreductase [Alkalihalobacillus hemicellulosilyticus]|uniref:2-hydroxy-3-oxopropionate reductase n=1 Tax=Halalkalibacter hemicellulosilyticusJCM 9152 TaxID=1236971 RepID=W4QLK0_9BACI|nr:NAD(P)-binding domain-containing protein [Halalkalibacter hemicellulosilyticus]GAE32513.1 2-hydroxy-3-oxopropionate reductase [Halalkalibacter hemicellulosilyticusJCM 9152]